MPFSSRVLYVLALLCIPLLLNGCADNGSTLSELRKNPVLRNAARAVLMGKAFDRVVIATRDRNGTLLNATNDFTSIDPLAVERIFSSSKQLLTAAEQLVDAASKLDMSVQNSNNISQRKKLVTQATETYRAALRISPQFPSRDANLLNALGYFLADRGQMKSDFQNAESLARASLKLWEESIGEIKNAPMSGQILAARKFMRANTRDSLAWALFRQGKFQDAKTEQTAALKDAEASAGAVNEKVPADLYFHMGEIERALKNFPAAKLNYESALKVEPDHEPSLRAQRALNYISPKTFPKASPPVEPRLEKPIPDVQDLKGALQARSTPMRTSDVFN